MTNETSALLVSKLAELTPKGLDHIHFTTGGSTAIDTAVRMVHYYQASRGYPSKKLIIARNHSYHGSTYAAMSAGKRPGDHVPEFQYMNDIFHHISCPNPYRRPEGMEEGDFTELLVKEFEDTIERLGVDNIGGFFAEPIQASGGVIVPPDHHLRPIRAASSPNDILFLPDEVVTAFGRLGHWFASEDEFDMIPDIILSLIHI